jgi:hypothetical protein
MCIFFLLLSGIWTEARLEEIEEALPFPPGKNAKLVKQVCASCHAAEMVYFRFYDEKSAEKYYELMVSDPDPEKRKKIIEYLTTVLG